MANFELKLSKSALDDTLFCEKEIIEYDNDVSIDDDLYARILAAALDVTEDDIKNYGSDIRPEYDNLMEAWNHFCRAVVFHAADEVLENDED